MLKLRWPPNTLFLLALIVPVLVKLALLSPDRLFEPHFIALELIQNGEFRYWDLNNWNYNYQFPIYPMLVALIYAMGSGPVPVLIFHVLLSAGSAFFVYRITRSMIPGTASKNLALLGMLLAGLDPFTGVYHVRMVHPFALDMFLSLLLLYLSLSIDPNRWRDLLKWAVVAGIAALDRTTLIVFALPLLLRFAGRPPDAAKIAAALLLIVLPTSLWLLRNHAIYDAWNLNSSTGQNLWIGIQEKTGGTAQMSDARSWHFLLDKEDLDQLKVLDPVEQSRFFINKWKHELAAEPGLWSRMMGVKLKNFWLFRDSLGVDQPQVDEWVALSFKILSIILLLAAVIALAIGGGMARQILITLFMLSLFQAFFYVETRHKLLIQPLLIAIALTTAHQLIHRISRRHDRWQDDDTGEDRLSPLRDVDRPPGK